MRTDVVDQAATAADAKAVLARHVAHEIGEADKQRARRLAEYCEGKDKALKLSLETKLDVHELLGHGQKKTIDLTTPTLQSIGEGLLVSVREVQAHLSGLVVKGRVVNTNAVTKTAVNIKMQIGKTKQGFMLKKVSRGGSSRFSVFVPRVDVKHASYADMWVVNSVVSYRLR